MPFAPNMPARRELPPALCCAIALLLAPQGAARAVEMGPAFVQVEGHASFLSDVRDEAVLSSTFGYGVRGGYRFGRWGVFAHIEQNMWLALEQGDQVVDGALNFGLGAEFIYADGFVRTSVVLGPSVLLFDTTLDDAGATGLYAELRPAGLRWALQDWLFLSLDPLTFALVMPVLDGIPLVRIEYRTVLATEFVF